MTPALIDLHVCPVLNETGQQDAELLAVQARDHGLDGLAVVAADEAVSLGETAELSLATGVYLFAGVELATDAGRLVCFPRALDEWYRTAGWRSLPRTGTADRYSAEAVVQAFADRGGAVVAVAGAFEADPPARPAGLVALDVTAIAEDGLGGFAPHPAGAASLRSALDADEDADAPEADPEAAAERAAADPARGGLSEAALQSAFVARLACVAGSQAAPGDPRFGAVATVFASPPCSQESLVDGLRSGRMWPVEIGAAWAHAALQPRRPTPSPAGFAATPPVAPAAGSPPGANGDARTRGHAAPSANQFPSRKSGRYADPYERPGDGRGNRLNREALRRRIAPMGDEEGQQPAFDPVAAMYGLDGRKVLRFSGKSDLELDRINGNRAKGPDPNIMVLPAFDELRQERQHVNLLFCQTDEEDDEEDSVSLTWALSYFHDEDGQPNRDFSQMPGGPQNRQRRRRRR